jgi:hypothetical protein
MRALDKGLPPIGTVAGFTLLMAAVTYFTPKRPSHHVTATIVEITSSGARFPRTIIIARAPRAMEARASPQYPEELHCKVGDDVDGKQTGVALVIDPTTCRRPQISSVRRP